MSALPSPSPQQSYYDVSVIHGGQIQLPEDLILMDGREGAKLSVPALSFLLIHSSTKRSFLFDLGINSGWKEYYPPGVQKRIKGIPFIINVPQDVATTLLKGSCDPSTIDYVCLSHVHWDHIGDTKSFSNATFLVGKGAQEMVDEGYPKNPDAMVSCGILPQGRTQALALDEDWKSLGPFPHALDFFGDGSLYIIDAPGHAPGHINLLARTSSDGGWVYLGGDSAHSQRLIKENPKVPVRCRMGCMHMNKEVAEKTIGRIHALKEAEKRVRVMIAHDTQWYEENKDKAAFWPSKLASL